MTELQKQPNAPLEPSFFSGKWRKRALFIYAALIAIFYLLHVNLLTYVSDVPEPGELLTSHDWTWYYPALGLGSVLVLFAIAKVVGFGLKRKMNYWEEH